MNCHTHLGICLFLSVHVASADPVITEFMASNQNSISDEDGFKADWIEIHNPDNAPVDMDGWGLTDSATNLLKWTFPAVSIPAKGHLIVYASSKNRRVAGQPLHTNFALSAGGEYLALVKPDGTTKATEFAPTFPQQFGDISYGVAGAVAQLTVIGQGSAAKVRIPANAGDGTAWRDLSFDDGAWTSSTLAVGYFNYNGASSVNLTDRLGLDLTSQMAGVAQSAYLRIPFSVPDASVVRSLKLRMNYDDAFAAFVNGGHVVSSAASPALGALTWQSGATTQHSPVVAGASYEEMNLSAHLGLLVDGANVLALHGLNAGSSSSDFYMEPHLVMELLTAGGGQTGYFREATPGVANGGPETLQLPQTVSYSRPSGPFTSGFSLALTGAAAGQQIRYVLADPTGSPNADVPAPTITSSLYTGPIAISSSKIIRAAVFNPSNGQKGANLTGQYLLLETGGSNNTSNFTSRIPIVVVDQHGGGGFGPGEDYKTSFLHVFDRAGGTATLDSVPTVFSRISHKVRGSSSAHFPKRAYGMKTRNEEGENLKRGLAGLSPDNNWVWYNPWKFDDAYVRNAFMFQLSRDMGQWASRTQPVEMFLNVNGGKLDYSDYHGVYVLTEKIESGGNRLDVETIGSSDTGGDALTGAYILKIDRADADETSWTTPMAQAGSEDKIVIVEPEQEDEKPEQVSYIQNYIASFETALQADRNGNWQTRNYQKYIDTKSWIDVHMLNSFALNPDSFRLSSYFHKDRNEKLKAGPIWDFDRGLFSDKDAGEQQDQPRQWNGTHFDMSWWKHVWRDPEFIQAWVDRWWELRPGAMADSNINHIITTMGEEIGNTVGARDAARWPGAEGNTPESGSYLGEIATLRGWLTSADAGNLGRTNWIDTQVPRPPSASLASAKVDAGTVVSLTGAVGSESIRYRLDGVDPRPVGGGDSNAATYTQQLTINQTTVLKARRRTADGGEFTPFPHNLTTRWSAPLTRVYLVNEDFATAADLAVSEIHYDPLDPAPGEVPALLEPAAGHFEYVELRNTGNRTVNTYGIRFEEGSPFKALTLEPLTLPPGGFAIVVKNRAAFLARFGPGSAARIAGEWGEVSLANEGETIRIIARDGSTIHDAPYIPAADGGASLVNVGGGWKMEVPSPGALGPTYSQWKSFHFPAGGSDVDGDLDGAGSLLEYGLGTNPHVWENQSAVAPVFSPVNNGTAFKYTFIHPLDRPGAIYQAEISQDLRSWTDCDSTLVSTAGGMVGREVNIPVVSSGPSAKFLRLKVILAP